MRLQVAVCAEERRLSLFIDREQSPSRGAMIVDGRLDWGRIDGFPGNGIGEPSGGEPDEFPRVAEQGTLIHFWSACIRRSFFRRQCFVTIKQPGARGASRSE